MNKKFVVEKSKLAGAVTIPPSKSQTLRAILFGLLAKGKTVIHNPLSSPDTQAMLNACRLLGGTIQATSNKIIINGVNRNIRNPKEIIHVGNSGITLRFISAIAALSSFPLQITGDYSICTNRPLQPLLDGLNQLGASARSLSDNGFAPASIQGPLRPGKASLVGTDSQPVSALLIACSFINTTGYTTLHVNEPGELPWIDLTLHWLSRLGIFVENYGYSRYVLKGNHTIEGFEYYVPGDWSSAAFPIIAALITQSEITLHNVDYNDSQGDKKLISILESMGATFTIDHDKKSLHVHVQKEPLKSGTFDINDCIDSIAALAVVACFAEGTTQLTNAAVARNKECDRIHCLAKELKKMGANIEANPDGLTIHSSKLTGAILDSHHDHRLCMAFMIAGMGAAGATTVQNSDCIAKTYPDFYSHFTQLGANIRKV